MPADPPFTTIPRGDARYPVAVAARLSAGAPEAISARGDLAILQRPALALFCSIACPGDVILRTYDLARDLRDAGVTVAGGFHSPMERECLHLLLRGTQPMVVCPAREIAQMRLPREWRAPLAEGRLLLLSPFAEGPRRATAELALARNLFLAALAGAVLIAHARPGGRTERFAAAVVAWGLPLLTLESPHNGNLVALGARPWTGHAPWAPQSDAPC